MIGTVSPAQSTNSLSPATCVCRILGARLFPQNHQRYAAAFEIFVHLRPIGQRLRRALVEARRRKQKPFQLGVADLWRDRPRDPEHLGTVHVLADGRLADACSLAHLTHAQPQLMRQPQYLSDLPHRHSHPGHRLPLWFFTGTADLLIRMSMGALAKRSSETVRNHRNAVRDGQESAVELPRCTVCRGCLGGLKLSPEIIARNPLRR